VTTGAAVNPAVDGSRANHERDGADSVASSMADAVGGGTRPGGERRWHAVFAESPIGIGVTNRFGLLVEVNDALCEFFGRDADGLLGHAPSEFAEPDDPFDVLPAESEISYSGDGALRVAKRYVRPDGAVRVAWLTAGLVDGDSHGPWTVAYFQDVTERRANEEALLDFETSLAAIAGVVRQIQSGGDARHLIVDAARMLARGDDATLFEPAADRQSLRATASTAGSLLHTVVPVDGGSAPALAFAAAHPVFVADTGKEPEPTTHVGAASLTALPVRSGSSVSAVLVVDWSSPLAELDERRARILEMLADQAAIALRQLDMVAVLEDLALTDALTGIPNRRSWEQLIGLLVASARRSGRPLTVALADLDHFKRFNDERGHRAGDILLHEFARGARRRLREGDVIARWGGEEFALALPECGAADAPGILDRVRRSVPSAQTCSIGYAEWDGKEPASHLMERVDQALYDAKNAGRDQIAFAEPTARRFGRRI